MVDFMKRLPQKAVLWPFSRYDADATPIVTSPVEIKAYWDSATAQTLESDETPTSESIEVYVDRTIAIDSVLRLGALLSLPSPLDDLYSVTAYKETPDIKGRNPARRVTLMRLTKIPTIE